MIVRPSGNWLRMLFAWDGSVLQSILPQLLLMLIVSSLALLTGGRIFGVKIPLDTAPFPLVGVSLAIFLAFRNNASYERFVDARRIWGHILIAARALTSQTIAYFPGKHAAHDRRLLVRRLIAFVYALNHQLRRTDPQHDLSRYLDPQELQRLQGLSFVPIALLDTVRRMLAEAAQRQPGQDKLLWMLDAQVNELAAAVGGCERISNTPIPYPYGVLLHRTVYMYCFLLPFGLVNAIGVATPLISVFVAYTLFALEAIAQQVAEPFGLEPNCLALNAMTRNIERSLLEMCGEAIPQAIDPSERYELN
jgi:ion channel-forming bestrophin family protein